jgi:hypothetical protein
MSIGRSATKADVDQVLAQLAQQLFASFRGIAQFKSWLDGITVQNLVDLGYLSGEANGIKSAMSDLEQLRTIFEGTTTLAVAKDFRTFAKQALGPGTY